MSRGTMSGNGAEEVIRVRDIELCLWNSLDPTPASEGGRIYLHKDSRGLSALKAVLDSVAPRRMVEIGIFHGGSVIYWTEEYSLDRMAAFDAASGSPELVSYLERHRLTDRVRLHFGVLQDDVAALRTAMIADFENELLDVVIDDASHLYDPSRASLEILLPFVRPGGAYIIEDWAWPPMLPLLAELPLLIWDANGGIDKMDVHKNFLVLWRDNSLLPTDGTYRLPKAALVDAATHAAASLAAPSDGVANEAPAPAELPMSPQAIEALVTNRAFEVAKPYVSEGVLLPPVCTAMDLRASIVEKKDWFDNPPVPGRIFITDSDFVSALAALERDSLPIPAFDNREAYGTDDAAYWLWGFEDFTKVRRAAERLGVAANRVLDFGGSSGRVYRHFYAQDWSRDIYACDFKQVTIDWCRLYLPAEIKVFLNSYLPSLPFPDEFFDVITAFSVFTHIDEFEDGWLLELSRVLRPGGVAYLTIHDENTWAGQIPILIDYVSRAPQAAGIDLTSPMSFGRRAFSFRQDSHYSCNVFHSNEYIKKYWGRFFQIESIEPFGHQIQAVVIARKAGGS
jgi:SAM-dependent methyltransferase